MKFNFQEEIEMVIKQGKELLKENDINVEEDTFTIVQQYDDGQAILVRIVEDGDGQIRVEVLDTVVSLPKKDGTLDVFC